MINTKLKYIWDRHHRAKDRKDKTGIIELYIRVGAKKKHISTGIAVQKSKWNAKEQFIQGIQEAQAYNLSLAKLKIRVIELISQMERDGMVNLSDLDEALHINADSISFLEYIRQRIHERKKTKAGSTIRKYYVFLKKLKEWKKIRYFNDITQSNIRKFDEYLRDQDYMDETVYNYHKQLKLFINDAIVDGYINDNPYNKKRIYLRRGTPNTHKYVDMDELGAIRKADIRNGNLQRVRDLFVFQCYTGMSYIDIMSFDFTNTEEKDGVLVLSGKRIKTGIPYHFVILSEAKKILEKYNFTLPKISNQKYNDSLKLLAEKCDIDKPLSTHYGRRTAGMIMLNNGVPIGIVSRILGHASIKTTEKAYAFLLDKTIDDAMLSFERKIQEL